MAVVSSREKKERRKQPRRVREWKMAKIPKSTAQTLSQGHFWTNLCRTRILALTLMRRK